MRQKNPFPVYPVSSLRDIASGILQHTVYTDAVKAVEKSVVDYAARGAVVPRAGLAMPVRGDYGTGKTHLLLFAQARLCQVWPGGQAYVTALLAPTRETTFPNWYLTVIAPLVARLDLAGISARLLAEAAYEVAVLVPLTAGVARQIQNDPLEAIRCCEMVC